MKNWEKYEEEIREIGVNLFAVIDGKPCNCNGTPCSDCDFHKQSPTGGSCSRDRTEWLYQDVGIVVGDVVKHDLSGTLMYVTEVNGDSRISGVVIETRNGNIGHPYVETISASWIKTNKHIPLDKVIEFIGGTN